MSTNALNKVKNNEIKRIGKTEVPGSVSFRHSN